MTGVDTTTHQQPRGWDSLIHQVQAATDRASFMAGMLELQCIIVAADYGAIWLIDKQGKPQLAKVWPQNLTEYGPDSSLMKIMHQCAASGVERKTSHVLKIETDQDAQDSQTDDGAHAFVTVMRANSQVAAICTTVAQCHDPEVIHRTGPMRELAAGLYENFLARKVAAKYKLDAGRVRRALALVAVTHEGRGFHGACLNLVNELARQHQCSRVTVGWVKGPSVHLVAMSDTEHLKRHSEQVVSLESAMSECLDQQQPIVYPIADDAEPMLAQAVVYAHKRMAQSHNSHRVLSIPLRHGDDWVGAITLEWSDAQASGFSTGLIQQLQLVADVIAPHLADRKRGDRFLITHAWHAVRTLAAYFIGPKHVGWKILGIAVFALLIYAGSGTWPYRVTSPFVLKANAKRVIAAPYEARLNAVLAEPGDLVKAGQLLGTLNAIELKLELVESQSQLKAATLEKSKATAEKELADAQQAQARIEQIRAHISLLQYRIDRSEIRSPIQGVVLTGHWRDKIGSVIELGQPLFEVAPVEDLIAIVRVSESDIDQINTLTLPTGQLATRSQPEEKFDFLVTRIIPLATPIEGQNVFEVQCHLADPAPWLRPGMQGLAKINAGDRRITWIATHQITDTLRLWLWW